MRKYQIRAKLRTKAKHYKVKGMAFENDDGSIELKLDKGEALLPEDLVQILLIPVDSED